MGLHPEDSWESESKRIATVIPEVPAKSAFDQVRWASGFDGLKLLKTPVFRAVRDGIIFDSKIGKAEMINQSKS
jgi:hypothetical protein